MISGRVPTNVATFMREPGSRNCNRCSNHRQEISVWLVRVKDFAGPEERDHLARADVFDGMRVSRRNVYYLVTLSPHRVFLPLGALNMAHPDDTLTSNNEEFFGLR